MTGMHNYPFMLHDLEISDNCRKKPRFHLLMKAPFWFVVIVGWTVYHLQTQNITLGWPHFVKQNTRKFARLTESIFENQFTCKWTFIPTGCGFVTFNSQFSALYIVKPLCLHAPTCQTMHAVIETFCGKQNELLWKQKVDSSVCG